MSTRFLPLLVTVSLMASCTSAYKTGQTPDDVYFSPGQEGEAYVVATPRDNGRYRNYAYDNPQDRWLRMRVRNPYLWNTFDNYDFYSPGLMGYSRLGWTTPFAYNYSPYYWSNVWSWNSFYNPYYTNVVFLSPKSNPYVYNNLKRFSVTSYTNRNYSNSNNSPLRSKSSYRTSANNNYNNSNNSFGDSFKKVFSGSSNGAGYTNGNTYTPSSYDRPVRTYTPSASGASSGSRSSGGLSRPGRGN